MSNTNKCAIAIPQVLDRKSKTKRKHGNINGPISKSVVEQYINALTYLYNHQLNIEKLFNKYDNPPIRERDISDIIDLKPNKIKNIDRGIGTTNDGFTSKDQLARILAFYLGSGTVDGVRNALAMALSTFRLLRGDNLRKLELPDYQGLIIDDQGSSRCLALVWYSNKEKLIKLVGSI